MCDSRRSESVIFDLLSRKLGNLHQLELQMPPPQKKMKTGCECNVSWPQAATPALPSTAVRGATRAAPGHTGAWDRQPLVARMLHFPRPVIVAQGVRFILGSYGTRKGAGRVTTGYESLLLGEHHGG